MRSVKNGHCFQITVWIVLYLAKGGQGGGEGMVCPGIRVTVGHFRGFPVKNLNE